jgi:hypothetical protein
MNSIQSNKSIVSQANYRITTHNSGLRYMIETGLFTGTCHWVGLKAYEDW